MKLIFIFLILFVVKLNSVSSHKKQITNHFTCHCDICSENNYKCETKGFCFVSKEIYNGTEIIRQRCYDEQMKSHFIYPSICERPTTSTISSNCCKGNLCNDVKILPPIKDNSTVIQTTLTCHCTHCQNEHYMCATDGFCYLSWKKTQQGLIFTQGCYDRNLFFPPDDPIFCENRQIDNYGRMCCDKNFCNAEDLKSDPGINFYALIFFVAFVLSMIMIFYLNLR